jgi:hypothetical protein
MSKISMSNGECTRKKHTVRIKVYRTEVVEHTVSVDDYELTGSVEDIYSQYVKLQLRDTKSEDGSSYVVCAQACCTKSVAATGLEPEEINRG